MIDKIIHEMIALNSSNRRRINHSLKVFSYAKCIGESQNLPAQEQEILEVAAVLHDIGIKFCEEKYGSGAGKYQEIEGPAIAREILEKHSDDEELIKRVEFLIAHHHTYDNIVGLDYRIIIESDFLVNLDEGNVPADSILKVKENYFRTEMGLEILNIQFDL